MVKPHTGAARGVVLSIVSAADLIELSPYRRRAAPIARIEVRTPGLPEADCASYEKRLNRHYFACGCGEASVAGIAGVVAAALWVGAAVDGWADLSWHHPLLVVAAFFIATGIGKFAGRLVSQHRLAHTVAALRSELMPPPADETHVHGPRCGFGRWQRPPRNA